MNRKQNFTVVARTSNDTQLSSDPKRMSSVALKAYFNITSQWHLTSEQERILLGNIPKATFYRWKENLDGNLSDDTQWH